MKTAKYHDGFIIRCSYCHNELKQGMGFDDPYCYCDCEKAKLELKMHREIYNETKEIEKKYEELLQIDENKIKEMKIKGHIYRAVFDSKLSIGAGFTKSIDVENAFGEAMKKVYKND